MASDLTTSVERLMALITTAAEATGFPVEIDRGVPYRESDLPLVLISTGELRPIPQSPQTWARYWAYSPYVEIIASGASASEARTAVNTAFSAFVDSLEAQLVANGRDIEAEPILAPGTNPEMNVMPFEVQGNSRARGCLVELDLEFLRG